MLSFNPLILCYGISALIYSERDGQERRGVERRRERDPPLDFE